MKTIKLLAVLLTLLTLSHVSLAQGQNYKHINANGDITNEQGQKIGLVTKERMILDNKGKKLAFVDGQGNLVDAKTGKKMGRIGKDGKSYLDENGELLFTIKDKSDKTCDIVDNKGKIIGNVHESLKGSACALHCFQSQMTSKPDHSKMKHGK